MTTIFTLRGGNAVFQVKDPFMQNPIILDLLDYWERLRAGRVAPLRSDINPRDITAALDHTFVLESDPHHGIRFRLAGSAMCALMGMELRGMPARSLIESADRETLDQCITDLLAMPKIVELHLESVAENGQVLRARMLLLPLQGAFGKINRVLGCLVADGNAQTVPQRFSITEQKTTRIVATQRPLIRTQTFGFAVERASFEQESATQMPGHLYSIKGNATAPLDRRKPAKPVLKLVKGGG